MRVQVMSDLHAEFMRDEGRSFIRTLPDTAADVLILAGDIGVVSGGSLFRMLDYALARFRHVVYVTGNHEYYRSSPPDAHARIGEFAGRNPRLHWLDAAAVEIEGQRFLGAALWFPEPLPERAHLRRLMTDFEVIPHFEPWVYEQHRRAAAFLEANVQPGDVVVTHHIPSTQIIHPRWRTSALNPFFASDTVSPETIGRAAAWVYGHTHDSKEDRIGAARVVVNPFGYAGYEENPNFDPGLCLDL